MTPTTLSTVPPNGILDTQSTLVYGISCIRIVQVRRMALQQMLDSVNGFFVLDVFVLDKRNNNNEKNTLFFKQRPAVAGMQIGSDIQSTLERTTDKYCPGNERRDENMRRPLQSQRLGPF